jgi:hypothetical protein
MSMGDVLYDTPEALVWIHGIVTAYLLAGVAIGLVVAADGEVVVALASAGAAVGALIALQIAKKAAWIASTRPGRWLWRLEVRLCADSVIEREQLLAEVDDRFDRGEET